MKCNVGAIDRLLRILIGLAIAVAGIILKSYWGVVGIVVMATGLFGVCLLYSALGISSVTGKKKDLED
jgi:hypothetical protein